MRRVFLCGAGNPEGVRLALQVNARDRRWDELVLLDDDPAALGRSHLGLRVAGPFTRLSEADPSRDAAVNLVARTTARRRTARTRIATHGIPFAPLVSPDVDLLGVTAGADLTAYPHATIGPEVMVGEGVVVFMGAVVGHECRVADHCVLAANSVLNARVRLGEGVYVGSGAVILPEVEVGAEATIGAGAVVIADVPAGATVVGAIGEVTSPGAGAASGEAIPDLDILLQRAWCETLGISHVDPSRNFFDLGGTSLLALRLAQTIGMRIGRRVSSLALFEHPTLASLGAHLGGAGRDHAASGGGTQLDQAERRAALRRARQVHDLAPAHHP